MASGLRDQWREISLEKKLTMFVAPVFVAVLSAVLVAVVTGAIGGGGSEASKDSPQALKQADNLEILDLSVADGQPGKFLKQDSNGPVFSKSKPPFVDVTVRNTGSLVAVITHVAFRIRQFSLVRICQAGGGLEPGERYDVMLPARPQRGQVVETSTRVSQMIEPNRADRFVIHMNVPNHDAQFAQYLYQLEVWIYQGRKIPPVNAGLVRVAAPFLPAKDDFAPVPPAIAARVPHLSPAWPNRDPEGKSDNAVVDPAGDDVNFWFHACELYNRQAMRWFTKLTGAAPPNLHDFFS